MAGDHNTVLYYTTYMRNTISYIKKCAAWLPQMHKLYVSGMIPSRCSVATQNDCTIELQLRERAHARPLHCMDYPWD